jgi:hypothetical protein
MRQVPKVEEKEGCGKYLQSHQVLFEVALVGCELGFDEDLLAGRTTLAAFRKQWLSFGKQD